MAESVSSFTNVSTSSCRPVDAAKFCCLSLNGNNSNKQQHQQQQQAFHVNPLTWAFRAAVLNEFQSPAYDKVCVPEVAEGEECPQDQRLGQVRTWARRRSARG